MAKILLAGEGWGAKAALHSLKITKVHQLFILTNNEEWRDALIQDGFLCVNSMEGRFDLIICAAWRPIIKRSFLASARVLNIHYTLLPAYRGMHGTVWAILNNEPKLGFTVHRMNEFIDDGPIVYQYAIDNDFEKTATWYMEHFNQKVQEVLLQIVDGYLSGNIPEIPQDKSKASWVGRRKLKDCAIDFTRSLDYQKAFFRALNPPYPYPFFILKNQIFEVHSAGFHHSSVVTDYGRILNIDDEGVWISCDKGYIICKKIIQQDSGKAIPYDYFKIGQFIEKLN
jgi:methionyl-tRNA formyltransferase